LRQELEGALGRAQVAAAQAKVGVDHAHQIEAGEVVSLGRGLGGDQNVDVARGHGFYESAGGGGVAHRVGREHR
jgi:hypothetical protein